LPQGFWQYRNQVVQDSIDPNNIERRRGQRSVFEWSANESSAVINLVDSRSLLRNFNCVGRDIHAGYDGTLQCKQHRIASVAAPYVEDSKSAQIT